MMSVCCSADSVLRGMLRKGSLFLRGYGDFGQSLLMLSDLLRDARVDFNRKGDRVELTELCDNEVNFAFER